MPLKKCSSWICSSIAQQKNHSKFLWHNTGKFTREMRNCFYLNTRYDKSTGKQESQNRDKKQKRQNMDSTLINKTISERLPPMNPDMTKYEAVIGLEIHVQLNAATKLFCDCPNQPGDAANNNICPVCPWLPGALPRLSAQAVEKAVLSCLAANCTNGMQHGTGHNACGCKYLPAPCRHG